MRGKMEFGDSWLNLEIWEVRPVIFGEVGGARVEVDEPKAGDIIGDFNVSKITMAEGGKKD